MTKMSFNARAIALSLLLALPLSAQVAEGDQHYARRGEGAQGARARGEHIDAAMAAFQRAVSANPNDIEAHWKLLRAYRFKGAYVATTTEQKKQIYGVAKDAGAKAVQAVNARLRVTDKTAEKQVADAARAVPGTGEVFLWDAINWGEWALAYGKLAAARQGAADRIRREATIAHIINPRMESGTPSRVLGRLHDQTPRIPLITGWASSKDALRFLGESLKIDPKNKITIVFLAEAMVSSSSDRKKDAVAMLRDVVSAPIDPQFAVEDAAAVADARALLKKWGA
jgi:tetratricopeptide (TPR) repeat protein